MNALREKIERKKPNRRILRIFQELKEYLRSKIKEKDRQINMAKPTNLIKALIVTAKIRDTRVRILINFEYLDNFVSPDFVKKV